MGVVRGEASEGMGRVEYELRPDGTRTGRWRPRGDSPLVGERRPIHRAGARKMVSPTGWRAERGPVEPSE